MSQSGSFNTGSTPPPPSSVLTLTGNAGGAVGPDGGGNINTLGDGTVITVTGNPGTNTLTATIATASTTQLGAVELATNAQAIAGTDTANAVTSAALKAKLGTQTAHGVAIGEGTASALHWSNVGTNGQVLIGANAADPAFATLTSTGGTILFTPGANSLNLEAAGAGAGITVDADSGSATPAAGILNLNGAAGGNITTHGAGNTLTVAVSGTTTHAVQIGNASGSLTSLAVGATNTVLLGNTAADPSFGTVPNAALQHSSITVTGDNNISVGGSPVSLGGTLTLTSPSFTQYDLVTSGAASTLESLPDGTGAAGRVLTSNGAGAFPTWQVPTGSSSLVTTFTSSGTFSKNANTKYISLFIVNAGSGGGSGSCGNSGSAGGGGAGSAGAVGQYMIPATFLGANETVIIGAAGSGGGSVTAGAPTNGNNGTVGGVSSLGKLTGGSNLVLQLNGQGGQLGSSTYQSSFVQAVGMFSFSFNGANSTGGAGGAGTPSTGSSITNVEGIVCVTGGAGGAGANNGVANSGGSAIANNYVGTSIATTSAGGIETGTLDGANGVGSATSGGVMVLGMGGGGGGGQKAGSRGGTGGNGGGFGCGGGGGGGSLLGSASGAGGNGSPGYIQIIEFM